jgi:hypothetical protein
MVYPKQAEIFATSCVTSGVPMLVIVINFSAVNSAEQNFRDQVEQAPLVCDM